MKLFLISQNENTEYDSYDSAVVAAPNEGVAQTMHPNGESVGIQSNRWNDWVDDAKYVTVRYLGEAAVDVEQGVICASFNAG